MNPHLDVVGAVILRNREILCARRALRGPLGGMWEFPGGKVEDGETRQAALAREIYEELGCRVQVGGQIEETLHHYERFSITLTTFWCELVEGEPHPHEHSELRWVPQTDLEALKWAPADVPAVQRLMAAARS